MKTLGVKKVAIFMVVVLTILSFSTLTFAVINVIKEHKDKLTSEASGNYQFYGSGTQYDPYLITSIEDMMMLSAYVVQGISFFDSYFELTTDLDFLGVDFMPIGAQELPSGSYDFKMFSGKFDGGGHTISNLKVNLSKYNKQNNVSAGLFACLGIGDPYREEDKWDDFLGRNQSGFYQNTVEVKNLQLYKFSSNLKSEYGCCYSGGITGLVYTGSWTWNDWNQDRVIYGDTNVKITNCIVNESTITSPDSHCWAGGLVGAHMTDVYPSNCQEKNRLFLTDCMVYNTTINAIGHAYISPALGLVADNYLFSWMSYEDMLMMNYEINRCVTNNSGGITIIRNERDYSHDNDYGDYYESRIDPYSNESYPNKASSRIDDVYDGFGVGMSSLEYYNNWVLLYEDESYYGWTAYLKTFTKIATWSKYPTNSDGSVDFYSEWYHEDDKVWKGSTVDVERVYIPKIPSYAYESGGSQTQVLFEYKEYGYRSEYSLNRYCLKATDGEVSRFEEWEITETEDGIEFEAKFTGMKFELSFISFGDLEKVEETGVGTYEVRDGTQITINTEKRNNKMYAITYIFSDMDGESCQVSYSVKDQLYYIHAHSLSNNIIYSNTSVTVDVRIKTYETQFG